MFGAGFVTIMNAASPLHDVNTHALRVTGIATMAVSLLLAKLPWERHGRVASYMVIIAAFVALVGADAWHHYSRNDAAIAVYPIFFVLIIAWAGLTQPSGTATIVACLSGLALAWLLHQGAHSAAAVQCVVVTVPAAAMLGEVVSWTYRRALSLGRLDAQRRAALEGLVAGASRLQEALTLHERESIVVAIANDMFAGRQTRFSVVPAAVDDGPNANDIAYNTATGEFQIKLRGQSGVLGAITTHVPPPDAFTLDAARLYSQHVGSRYEQLRMIDALTDAATHDALTGIANRRAAQTRLDELQPGDAVFLLDLDNFKSVNDTLGHQTGDELLTRLGDFLRLVTRPTDTIARYGGEEFILICSQTTPSDAERIANRLLDGWRKQQPLATFSIGWSVHEGDVGAARTIEQADAALYAAKCAGRNCSRSYVEVESENARKTTPG